MNPDEIPEPKPQQSQTTVVVQQVQQTETKTAIEQTANTNGVPYERPAAAWYWLKDSAGQPSISVTMVAVSFWLTTLVYIASIFEKIGPFTIREFSVGAATSYFGVCLTCYVSRRWTEAKYGNPSNPNINK